MIGLNKVNNKVFLVSNKPQCQSFDVMMDNQPIGLRTIVNDNCIQHYLFHSLLFYQIE